MMPTITIHPDLEQIFEHCADVARQLWDKGWAERNAGNISVDVTRFFPGEIAELARFPFHSYDADCTGLGGRIFLITGTGKRMRDLARKPSENTCILRISEERGGYHQLWGGGADEAFRPTSEFPSHLGIHRFLGGADDSAGVIIHTHPNALIALTHVEGLSQEEELNRILWSMHPETKVVIPEGVGFVSYRIPGSEALAEATVEALADHRVAVWEKHGCVAVGRSVFETFDLIDTLNKSAEIFLLCKGAGYTPEGLTPRQVDDLERKFHRGEDVRE